MNRRLNFNSTKQIENFANKCLEKDYYFPQLSVNKVNLKSKGWYFHFDNAKRRFGACYPSKKITLSLPLCWLNMDNNRPEIENTILHEVAHAIEFEMYRVLSHSRRWRHIHQEIGGTGDRLYSSNKVKTPKGKWTLTCPVCGHEIQRHKRPTKNQSCGTCTNVRRYDETRKLIITQNY